MKEIKLTQGKVALVDDSDYEFLNKFKWYSSKAGNTFYATRKSNRIKGKQYNISMHRVILGLKCSLMCDHIDHDGLNNQRNNIRIATSQQNNFNKTAHGKSKYLGVGFLIIRYKNKSYQYIESNITINKKRVRLGYFKTEKEAAQAYDASAKIHHGEFANLNFKLKS